MLLGSPSLFAQSVAIDKVELDGEKVIVHYNLQDSNPNNEYQLNLYSSKDNYMSPLTKVTGDVGNEVKSGTAKKIEWKLRDEFGPYKGKIALEIRGKMFVPFVKLQSFDTEKSYKRGKAIDVGWKAGATNPISIELMKGSQRVVGESNLANNGNHTIYVPGSAKAGKDYKLKITDSRTNDVIYSNNFAVKPKIPLLVKVLPVVAIGAAVGLAGGSKGKDTVTPPTNPAIELPIGPGGE